MSDTEHGLALPWCWLELQHRILSIFNVGYYISFSFDFGVCFNAESNGTNWRGRKWNAVANFKPRHMQIHWDFSAWMLFWSYAEISHPSCVVRKD